MADVHEVILFFHLAGVFVFLIAHGTSGAVGFRLRREREPNKVAAILEASGSTLPMTVVGWMVILITGIALGVETWLNGGTRFGWFYASLVVFILLAVLMTPLSQGYLKARAALGVKPSMVSVKSWTKTLAKGYTRDKLDAYLGEANP